MQNCQPNNLPHSGQLSEKQNIEFTPCVSKGSAFRFVLREPPGASLRRSCPSTAVVTRVQHSCGACVSGDQLRNRCSPVQGLLRSGPIRMFRTPHLDPKACSGTLITIKLIVTKSYINGASQSNLRRCAAGCRALRGDALFQSCCRTAFARPR